MPRNHLDDDFEETVLTFSLDTDDSTSLSSPSAERSVSSHTEIPSSSRKLVLSMTTSDILGDLVVVGGFFSEAWRSTALRISLVGVFTILVKTDCRVGKNDSVEIVFSLRSLPKSSLFDLCSSCCSGEFPSVSLLSTIDW